jgi:hypothetical protein
MNQILGKKAKTRKGKQHLTSLDAQLHEGPRNCAFLRGQKCSQAIQIIIQMLYLLKKKTGINFSKKKMIRPMEDQDKLKIISYKNRCPFICFG